MMPPPRVPLSACLSAVVVAVLLLLVLAEPVAAAPFASAGEFFRSFARRDRVIQLCVGAMLLGLFILMKKFSGHEER